MSPKATELTLEQKAVVDELQRELADLDLQASRKWAKYVKTGDLDCYNEVIALDGMIELKGLIAHMPKAGEKKVGRVKGLIDKMRWQASEKPLGKMVGDNGARYGARLETLASVNAWRESFGLPLLDRLPVGVIGDSQECTIARAFHANWQSERWQLMGVNISGATDSSLEVEDTLDGSWHTIDLSHVYTLDDGTVLAGDTAGWEGVISDFDSALFVDLLEDGPLIDRIRSLIESGLGSDDSEELEIALLTAMDRKIDLFDELPSFLHERLSVVEGDYVVTDGEPYGEPLNDDASETF